MSAIGVGSAGPPPIRIGQETTWQIAQISRNHMKSAFLIAAAVSSFAAGPVAAQSTAAMPDLAQALLDAAYATGDADEIAAEDNDR